MIRTNTTDAIVTTATILLVIALIDGKYATGTDWALRIYCVYPFTHLAWRGYRHHKHR